MKFSSFSSFYRSFHSTTISHNKFVPSKHPYVKGLYEFFQGGSNSPDPLPSTRELVTGKFPLSLFFFLRQLSYVTFVILGKFNFFEMRLLLP